MNSAIRAAWRLDNTHAIHMKRPEFKLWGEDIHASNRFVSYDNRSTLKSIEVQSKRDWR